MWTEQKEMEEGGRERKRQERKKQLPSLTKSLMPFSVSPVFGQRSMAWHYIWHGCHLAMVTIYLLKTNLFSSDSSIESIADQMLEDVKVRWGHQTEATNDGICGFK